MAFLYRGQKNVRECWLVSRQDRPLFMTASPCHNRVYSVHHSTINHRESSLAMLAPQLLLLSVLSLTAVAVDTSSSSTKPLIPKTASNPTVPSVAPSLSPTSKIPYVRKPTVKDIYDDDDLTSPRLCRSHDDRLLRLVQSQCPVTVDRTSVHRPPKEWSPWTHPPACPEVNTTTASSASLQFCMFTHANYNGGISIVATPETAAGLATILGQASIAQPAPPVDRPLLEIHDISGKGLGVVAGQAIPRGAVILRDQARILADVRFPQHVRRAQGQMLLHKAAGRLPVPDDVRNLSRSVKAKPGEALGILEENVLSTNSFAATVDGVAYMALFPEIAVSRQPSRSSHVQHFSLLTRLSENQPCLQSNVSTTTTFVTLALTHIDRALTRFNDNDLTQQVIAFRDIQPGEEITISCTFTQPYPFISSLTSQTPTLD